MSASAVETSVHAAPFDLDRQRAIARQAIAKRSFCTLATVSAANIPHVAGVLYVEIDGVLYVSMFSDSVKARNIRHNPRVAVCIPARKLPFFPPFVVQFQGRAELISRDDTEIVRLFEAGALKKIVKEDEFSNPQTCFARIAMRRISTYGLGVSPLQVMRDPTSAMRSVDL